MDSWNGVQYDDDPAQWEARGETGVLDPSVIRWRMVAAANEQTARLWVESANPGFQIVSIRKDEQSAIDGIWRAELWKIR